MGDKTFGFIMIIILSLLVSALFYLIIPIFTLIGMIVVVGVIILAIFEKEDDKKE